MLNGAPEWVAELATEVENVFADSRKQMRILIGIRDTLVAYDKRILGVRFTARAGSGAATIGACERNKSG